VRHKLFIFLLLIVSETNLNVVSAIDISNPPVANFSVLKKNCIDEKTCIYNTSTNANKTEDCSKAVIVWKVTPSSGFSISSGTLGNDFNSSSYNLWSPGSNDVCLIFNTPGRYVIKMKIANNCGSSEKTDTICIVPPPVPVFNLSSNEGCAPFSISTNNLTDESNACDDKMTYTWDVVSYSPGNCGTGMSYTILNSEGTVSNASSDLKNTTINFLNPGTYSLKLSAKNTCGTVESEINDIVVKAPPIVSINDIPDVCLTDTGAVIFPSANITNCGNSSLSYEWNFPTGTPSISFSANPGSIAYTTDGEKTISLKITNECGTTITTKSAIIHPQPIVNNIANQLKCANSLSDPIVFSGSNVTSCFWTNSNTEIGLAASGTGDISSFQLTNNTSAEITSTITVIPSSQYCTGKSKSFTITVKPSLNATISGGGNFCVNETPPTITFEGFYGTAPYTFTYRINQGQPKTISSGAGSNSVTIQPPTNVSGLFTYELLSVSDNSAVSCDQSLSASVIVNVLEYPNITQNYNLNVCNNEAKLINPALDATNIVPTGTTYTWDTPVIFPAGALTGATEQLTPLASLLLPALTNTTNTTATATFTVTPHSLNCIGNPFTVQLTVSPNPQVSFSIGDQTICSGSTSNEVTLSSVTSGVTNYTWTANVPTGITGATTTGNNKIPAQTLVNTTNTTQTVTYTARAVVNNGSDCYGNEYEYHIQVYPATTINAPANLTFCNNEQTIQYVFSSNIAGTTYEWTNDNPSIGLAANGTGNLPVFTATNAHPTNDAVATITVTPTANGCVGNPVTFTITVHPIPAVTQPGNQTVCNGDATTAINFTGTIPGTTYSWAVDKPEIGVAASGTGDIPAFQAINTGTSAVIATFTVTPNMNGCTGAAKTFTITVKPSLDATISVDNTNACLGSASPVITFTGLNGTAPYTFTYKIDNGADQTIVSAGSTATVNVPTGIVKNYTYTLTGISDNSALSCSQTLNKAITVNITEIPNITSTYNETVCSNNTASVVPVTDVNNTVPVGTTYTWGIPVIFPAGAITGGTTQIVPGSINISGLTNTTTAAATATYTVTPYSGTCSGASFNVVITVNPSPNVIFSQADQFVCSGSASQEVTLSSSTVGTTFSWIATVPAGVTGATLNGTDKIPVQTLTNTTNTVQTIVYKATATWNNTVACNGTEYEYRINVNPTLTVNQVSDVILCNNENSSAINFSSSVSGVSYEWTNDNAAIGLALSGTGNLPAFTATNANVATDKVAHISVRASLSGCTGDWMNFTITVHPTPTVDQPTDQIVCNDYNTSAIHFTGAIAGTNYSWTHDTPGIGLPTSGSGDIASFKAINSGTSPVIVTFTVTPEHSNCTGADKTFTITINPTPVFSIQPKSESLCVGGTPKVLNFTYQYATSAPNYQWYENTVRDSLTGTPVGTNATYQPSALATGSKYYYCVLTFPTGGCTTICTAIAEVKVNDLPVVSEDPLSTQQICVGGTIDPLIVKYNGGSGTPQYQWYSNTINSNVGGTAILGANSGSYTPNTFNSAGNNYFYAVINFSDGGCGTISSQVAEVVVVPDPVITAQPQSTQTICQSTVPTDLSVTATGGVGTFNYQWYESTTSGNIIINGANQNIYTPSTTSVGSRQYYCLISQTGLGCSVTSDISTVIVYPQPSFTSQPLSAVYCKDETPNNMTVTYQDGVGLPQYQWYSNTQNLNSGGTAIGGANLSQFAPATNVAGTTYYYCVITLPNGGCNTIISDVATITVHQYPVISDYNVNMGSGTTFTVQPSIVAITDIIPAGTTYTWSQPIISSANAVTGASAQSVPQNNISQTLTNTTTANATVTYTVTPTVDNCPGPDFKINVTVYPNIAVAADLKDVSCNGENDGSISLTVSGGNPPYSISWTGTDSFSSDQNDISGLKPGNYSLVVTDNGGLPFNAVYTINEPAVLAITTDKENDITCNGAANGEINVTIAGGTLPYTINWTKDDAPFSNTEDIANLTPGVYEITVEDKNHCTTTRSFTIQEPTELTLSGAVINAIDCDNVNSGVIDLTIKGGTKPYAILWSNNATTEDLIGIPAGDYSVQVSDANGCATQTQFKITRPAPISINISSSFSYDCSKQTLTETCKANVSGGIPPYHLNWSCGKVSGVNNEIMKISNDTSGILRVTDSLGCESSLLFTTKAKQIEVSYDVLDCNSRSYMFHLYLPDSIFTNVSYKWDFGDGGTSESETPQHTYLNAGYYNVKVAMSSNECNTTFSYNMLADTISVLTFDKPTKLCKNDSLVLTVSGADSYKWSNGTIGNKTVIRSAGDYTVEGITKNGCTATLAFTVTYYEDFNYSIYSDKDQVSVEDPTVEFWSEDISLTKYLWYFGDGSSEYGNHILHNYVVDNGEYVEVELHATNPNGCIEKANKRIWMSLQTLPNTFTPNGDGNNDVFLKGWNIEVYNSNGVLLYKGKDGWDGTYKGTPVKRDTYYYVVTSNSSKGFVSRAGFVTLVR